MTARRGSSRRRPGQGRPWQRQPWQRRTERGRLGRRPGWIPAWPRRTVRLRFTLLYLGLFLASAACLLVITYLLVARQLPQTATVQARQVSQGGAVNDEIIVGGTSIPTSCTPQSIAQQGAAELTFCQDAAQAEATGLRSSELDQLLVESGIGLGIMAVVSMGLGWLMAGRVLSPLRTITGTARRISARNLHQRIGMTGPDDELKELGDTFDDLLGRLDASFRAQRQFVANASHELRTPLARQRTLLEVALRDRQPTVDSLRAACERALVAGEQQERLIAALLTLARGERGLDRFEPFDLAALAGAAVAARQDEADAADVTVVPVLLPGRAEGDPRLAERLVDNLLDNAIRYNTAGGRVEVITGTRDGRACLTVANTGAVVPPEEMDRLFQPFQRLDGPRTGPGLGLGLAIVSAIAAAHGADLRAGPGPAGGLELEVVFPIRPADAVAWADDHSVVLR